LEQPDNLIANLSDRRLSLTWHTSSSFSINTAEVSMVPGLDFEFAESMPVHRIWSECVTPVMFLTTFATGIPDGISRIWVGEDASDTRPGAELRFARWWAGTSPESLRWWDFLVPFQEVEKDFESLLVRWFEIAEDARSALLEYFSVPLTSGMYLEDSFNRTVRSLELLHRGLIGGQLLPDDDYQTLLLAVKGALPKRDWDIASMRLRYGNEPTQKQRLDALVERSGDPVAELIQSFHKFTRRVVDKRNELTHGPQLGQSTISWEHMAWAQQCLAVVFQSVMLKELGFDEEQSATMIRDSGGWKQISWPGNVWVGEALGNVPLRHAKPNSNL
jgi:hypothetical protein